VQGSELDGIGRPVVDARESRPASPSSSRRGAAGSTTCRSPSHSVFASSAAGGLSMLSSRDSRS